MVQSVANAGAWYADDGDEYGGIGWDEWTSLEDGESPAIWSTAPAILYGSIQDSQEEHEI